MFLDVLLKIFIVAGLIFCNRFGLLRLSLIFQQLKFVLKTHVYHESILLSIAETVIV